MKNKLIVLKKDKNQVLFLVDRSVFSLEAIKNTCFVFLDRYYSYIKSKNKDSVFVQMEAKDKANVNKIVGEFYSELLNNELRKDILKNGKHIRELIIAKGLYSAVQKKKTNVTKKKIKKTNDDPLGIMMTWEEKYGK